MNDEAFDLAHATSVLLRYAAAIDDRDWQGLRECFAADCVATYDGRVVRGVEELIQFMTRAHRGFEVTLHRVTNVRIVGSSPARTTAYVDALLISRRLDHEATMRFEGVYRDTWAPTAHGWRIGHREFRTARYSNE